MSVFGRREGMAITVRIPSLTRDGQKILARLLRVVKDDAERVAHPGANAADAMPQIDAIYAFRTLNGPIVYGEGHRIALAQRHHLDAALHARTLLG